MSDEVFKLTPHTDALDTLGTIITSKEKRDAIHIGVFPVEAGESLEVGQHVYLVDGRAWACGFNEGLGIVDPYLGSFVEPGQWFWLLVYPRKISSLRHVWEHPGFPLSNETEPTADKGASELWLRQWCGAHDCPSFDYVVAACTGEPLPNVNDDYYDESYENDGEYITFYGVDAHASIPPEFWHHMSVYTGKEFDAATSPEGFSCSC